MAISENWPQLLEPGLREIFFNQRQALAARAVRTMIFNVLTSSKAVEHFLGAGGMGDVTEYTGAIEYDDPEQLYKTSLTHKEYSKGFKVSRSLVDDDQYNVINQYPPQLAVSFERTQEKHAASVLNNAFSSSYLGGDSKALCATDHPLAPARGGSHGNKGTSALSYDAVIATRKLMRAFVDDRGELMPVMPDTLIVPPELEDTANAIVNTDNKPRTAEAEDNFVRRNINKVIVWDYLTDANNWFLADSTLAKLHMLWIDRVATELAVDPTSNFRLEARYRGYARWSYGWSDWRAIYGHEVT